MPFEYECLAPTKFATVRSYSNLDLRNNAASSAQGGYAGRRNSTCPTSTLPGSGIGRPPSVSPWRCRTIASPMSCSASARVAPAATTPGRAGTKALHPVAVCSYTTVQVLNGPPSTDRIGRECSPAYRAPAPGWACPPPSLGLASSGGGTVGGFRAAPPAANRLAPACGSPHEPSPGRA